MSPHFPPSTLAGVHRARHLVKHLPAHGWRAKVICVDPAFHVERLDPDLGELVPKNVQVIKVGALPAKLTRLAGVAGDVGLRGIGHIRAAIAREMRTDKPDAVLITGSPYYPMLLTKWIERRWRTPVVLDFQDPWVSREGTGRAFGSKSWLTHRLALILEPLAVRHASFITSVSDRQNEEMADRYPWLDRYRMEGIPIGGDPEDFEVLRGREGFAATTIKKSLITMSYVGTAMPRSAPLLRVLFKGFHLFSSQEPQIADRVRLRFVGTSNQPNDMSTYRVMPIAKQEGVESFVSEAPARVPFLDALRTLSTTDIVLMIGSDELHYTASKIYPGLMSGRPFMGIFHRASSSYDILSSAGGGAILGFETEEELNALVPEIASALKILATNPEAVGRIDPAAFKEFTAYAVAGRFAATFDRALREPIGDLAESNAA